MSILSADHSSIDDVLLKSAWGSINYLKNVDKRCQRELILPETDKGFLSCYESVVEKINELELYMEDLKENKNEIPKYEFNIVMRRIKYFILKANDTLSKYTLLDDIDSTY